MRLAHLGFGDFRDAVRRTSSGGGETYTGQVYTIACLREIARERGPVTVVSLATPEYHEELEPGLDLIGLPFDRTPAAVRTVVDAIAGSRPTHLITRPLVQPVLRWAVDNDVRVLPTTASSFEHVTMRRPRSWWRYRRLVSLLNSSGIEWVCNHNVNSARSLARAGVREDKLIPWDMPPQSRPTDRAPKTLASSDVRRLVFVGKVSAAKGVGDMLRAVALRRERGDDVRLSVAGSGDVPEFEALATELGIQDAVDFLGNVAHDGIVALMAEHDAVLVPSRHEYPEGLPFVIYEAFCSRSPPIVSDHPMFRRKVVDGRSGVVFRASEPESLAAAIERLFGDADLYARLSVASEAAWDALQCPVKWRELIRRWLDDGPEDRAWLASHSLAGGLYDDAP